MKYPSPKLVKNEEKNQSTLMDYTKTDNGKDLAQGL